MKKLIFPTFVMILFMGIILSSCEKYEKSSSYTIDEESAVKATVEGIVRAELDLTQPGMEFAPSGTKIYIKIAVNEYVPNAPEDRYKIFTTTVGGDGKYSIEIPSSAKGVNFKIFGDTFRKNVTTSGDPVETVFVSPIGDGSVISDKKTIIDFNY